MKLIQIEAKDYIYLFSKNIDIEIDLLKESGEYTKEKEEELKSSYICQLCGNTNLKFIYVLESVINKTRIFVGSSCYKEIFGYIPKSKTEREYNCEKKEAEERKRIREENDRLRAKQAQNDYDYYYENIKSFVINSISYEDLQTQYNDLSKFINIFTQQAKYYDKYNELINICKEKMSMIEERKNIVFGWRLTKIGSYSNSMFIHNTLYDIYINYYGLDYNYYIKIKNKKGYNRNFYNYESIYDAMKKVKEIKNKYGSEF